MSAPAVDAPIGPYIRWFDGRAMSRHLSALDQRLHARDLTLAVAASRGASEQHQAEEHRRQPGAAEHEPDISERAGKPQPEDSRTECDPPAIPATFALRRSGLRSDTTLHLQQRKAGTTLASPAPRTAGPLSLDVRHGNTPRGGRVRIRAVRYRRFAGRRRLHRAYIRWFGGRALGAQSGETDRPLRQRSGFS